MTALIIVLGFLALALVLGLAARRRAQPGLSGWSIGGRRFGTVFVFLLTAGELYTTFTFLGASGWAYGKGGPAFYVICYGPLAYAATYWIGPKVWRYGKNHGLVSESDHFRSKFSSPAMGVLVAVVGIIALIPYLVQQLQGLGIIVSQASYGGMSPGAAAVLGAVVLAVYVTISGLTGSAWTSTVKDVLILAVVLFLAIYLPVHYFGGISSMFHAVDNAHPGYLALPDKGKSSWWFSSTVLLSVLGYFVWPHAFTAMYSARSEKVLRRNAVLLPTYGLILLFVLFIGFTAILVVPGLHGTMGDTSLLQLAKRAFPPCVVGIVGGAGVLTALVPGSVLLITASTILSKNIVAVARPSMSEDGVQRLARISVPVVTAVALGFALTGSSTIVSLLLMGYALVAQLFPAFLLSLGNRQLLSTGGAFTGIVIGVVIVAVQTVSGSTVAEMFPSWPHQLSDISIGILAMIVNVVVALAITAAQRLIVPPQAKPASFDASEHAGFAER